MACGQTKNMYIYKNTDLSYAEAYFHAHTMFFDTIVTRSSNNAILTNIFDFEHVHRVHRVASDSPAPIAPHHKRPCGVEPTKANRFAMHADCTINCIACGGQ